MDSITSEFDSAVRPPAPSSDIPSQSLTPETKPQVPTAILVVGGPSDTGADLGTFGTTTILNQSTSEQTELDKIEAAALNVVHQIEEKMAIVEEKIVTEVKAVEGVLVEAARKAIHVHLPAGGGSIIRNPD